VNVQLEDFRNEVEYDLTFGRLADRDLPVVNDQGESIVIVALAEERLSELFRRVDGAGGYANLFVKDKGRVHLVTIIRSDVALDPGSADDMTGAERPSLSSSVGVFLDYLRSHNAGVMLPAHMNETERPKARLDRAVELSTA